jgi:SAM-dependent methyltransferase
MAWDPVWEEIFLNNEWGKYPPERVIRFVARNFYRAPNRAEIKLLDLGSGPGACSWYMAREGFSVSAIDGSATGIRRAEKLLLDNGLSADLHVGDFRELPWLDQTFNGVIDNAAVYTNKFSDVAVIIQEAHRCLKPGGLFLSCWFTPRTWGFGLGEETETGGFVDIREGPLAGRGFSLFPNREQLLSLFSPFSEVLYETESFTLNNGANLVETWIVTARK